MKNVKVRLPPRDASLDKRFLDAAKSRQELAVKALEQGKPLTTTEILSAPNPTKVS